MFAFLIILILTQPSLEFSRNNACNTFEDYATYATNKNCWYFEDMDMNTPELIEKYTGNVESYKVTTEDGYILTIFRLAQRRNPRGAILLQHPMFADSRIYMCQGNESTALHLWRAGYDVWLSNMRGTLHAEGHVNLTVYDAKFWDFSFHEIGQYDISSTVQFIRKKSGFSKIFYFGHSLGTTNGLVYASMRPEEAKESIETFIFAGTACYYKYFTSPMIMVLYLEPTIKSLAEALGGANMIPSMPLINNVVTFAVRRFPWLTTLAKFLFSFLGGWTPNECDPVVLNLDAMKNFRNVSWKLAFHYMQLLRAKISFQMYDYGPDNNKKIYGTDRPLPYPISNISVPVYLISSFQDSVTTLEDSELLFENLPDAAKIYGRLHISGFNHNDYSFGKRRKQLLIDNMLKLLNQIGQKSSLKIQTSNKPLS